MTICVLLGPRGAGASTITRYAIANYEGSEGKARPLPVVTTRPGLRTDIIGKYRHPLPSSYTTHKGKNDFAWETQKDGVHFGTLFTTLYEAFQKSEYYWFVTLTPAAFYSLLEAAERFNANGHRPSALPQIHPVYLDAQPGTLVKHLTEKEIPAEYALQLVKGSYQNGMLLQTVEHTAAYFGLTVTKVDAAQSPRRVFTNVMEAILQH